MFGMFGDELSFQEVKIRSLFGINVLNSKSEESGEVQHEEEREVCLYASFAGVEVKEGVLDEIKQIGIGFGLFEAFLQELDHEEGYGVLEHIEEDMLIEGCPFHFFDPLEVFQLVVIDDKVEDGGGLEEVGFAGAFF